MWLNLILTVVSAVCFGLFAIPQILRIRKTKSARDCSIGGWALIVCGVLSATILAFVTKASWWFLVQQIINCLGSTMVFVLIVVYRLKDKQ